MGHARGKRKQKIGFVVSDKMNKTRVVQVERLTQHPLYKKTVKKFTRFKVHDEKDQTKVGDWVRIMEIRPISKDKRWRIFKIIQTKKG